jgi:hypothetical protein
MTKLLRVLLRQANNDRGNAVAIVLLVLAVTSLIGVGMLTQSRIDVKFATSHKSHATAFNLADGAASLALVAVPYTTTPMYEGHAVPIPPMNKSNYKTHTSLGDRGSYLPVVIFQGPITDPRLLTGEELETRLLESWTAKGVGKRRDTSDKAASNTEVRQGRHVPTEIDAQIPVLKSVPKN